MAQLASLKPFGKRLVVILAQPFFKRLRLEKIIFFSLYITMAGLTKARTHRRSRSRAAGRTRSRTQRRSRTRTGGRKHRARKH